MNWHNGQDRVVIIDTKTGERVPLYVTSVGKTWWAMWSKKTGWVTSEDKD